MSKRSAWWWIFSCFLPTFAWLSFIMLHHIVSQWFRDFCSSVLCACVRLKGPVHCKSNSPSSQASNGIHHFTTEEKNEQFMEWMKILDLHSPQRRFLKCFFKCFIWISLFTFFLHQWWANTSEKEMKTRVAFFSPYISLFDSLRICWCWWLRVGKTEWMRLFKRWNSIWS